MQNLVAAADCKYITPSLSTEGEIGPLDVHCRAAMELTCIASSPSH